MSFKPITTGIQAAQPSTNGQHAAEMVAETQQTAAQDDFFAGLDFAPAKDAFPAYDEINEVDESDLFNLAEREFKKRVPDANGNIQAAQPAPGSEKKSLGEIMPEGMIEISAEMYVEILEGAVAGLCQMFGDENGRYLFNKVYKEKYTDITKTFFKYQNVQITPGQLFVFCTIAIVSGSGLKAYKDRRAKIAASKFRKKTELTTPPGEQAKLFELNDFSQGVQRKSYQIDENGYYVKTVTGEYAKKGEREKCPDYLTSFIAQYFKQNGKWPGKKEIETYQNFNQS